MKSVILFICIALLVSTIQARPVVDANNQQNPQDHSVSSSGKDPDFFFRFLPPWLWPWIHPHFPFPISPAPHGAPKIPKIPKFPFPLPWAPGPKGSTKPHELEALLNSVDESSSKDAKNPDFFFFRPWWWWWYIFHHKPWSPAPHGAPSGHKPSKPVKGGDELQAYLDDEVHHINEVDAVEAEKCWSPLAETENCLDDIMTAFSSGKMEINSACCSAIKKLDGNNCVEKTIGSLNNHRFTNAVIDHCSSI